MSSIQNQIHCNPYDAVVKSIKDTVSVGNSIKDMPVGSMTSALDTHERKVEQITAKYEDDKVQYDKNLTDLNAKAKNAQKQQGEARRKRAFAITAFALSLIAVIGMTVALPSIAAITVAGGICLGIAILAVTIISRLPGNLMVDYHRKMKTFKKIFDEATKTEPGKLKKPELVLPQYDPERDLDLKESRVKAVNKLSQMTIAQLAASGFSKDEIVNYALLDGITSIPEERRPYFYAQCVRLLNAYEKIVKEHNKNAHLLEREQEDLQFNRAIGEVEAQYASMR
jgi:hypothetical protein